MTTPDESLVNDKEVIDFKQASLKRKMHKHLTDEEIIKLRTILQAFDKIAGPVGCPVAFRLLHGRTFPQPGKCYESAYPRYFESYVRRLRRVSSDSHARWSPGAINQLFRLGDELESVL